MNIEKELNYKLYKIKQLGWINCTINGYNKFGNKLENMLGIKENCSPEPDYKGIELKTKNFFGSDFITLFCCSPSNGDNAVSMLSQKYGYPSKYNKNIKLLNISVSGDSFFGFSNFLFKLVINKENKNIKLIVLTNDLKPVDNSLFWSFKEIESRLVCKTKKLCVVLHENKKKNNEFFSKIKKYNFYQIKSFDDFINCVEKGYIRVTFKIGVCINGENKGTIHNHGTSFDINKLYLEKLYTKTS